MFAVLLYRLSTFLLPVGGQWREEQPWAFQVVFMRRIWVLTHVVLWCLVVTPGSLPRISLTEVMSLRSGIHKLWCWGTISGTQAASKLYICSTCRDIYRITESQKHRMVEVGRNHWGSSSPTPLPKQGRLEQAAQNLVQAGLEYLQRRRLHNLPGQPVPVLRHPQTVEVLPHVQLFLCLSSSPCSVAGHHCKESGPILLTPTLKIFVGIIGPPEHAQDTGAAAGSDSENTLAWECLIWCTAEVQNTCRSSSAFFPVLSSFLCH